MKLTGCHGWRGKTVKREGWRDDEIEGYKWRVEGRCGGGQMCSYLCFT